MDLIFVTYNSEKWINNCFFSVENSNFDLKKLKVYIVDNNSSDNTIVELEKVQRRAGQKFGEFEIIKLFDNKGFGVANNLGAQKGKEDIICFFNIDTEIYSDTFSELSKTIESADRKTAMWELRQLPYEHPKLYDPIKLTTSWASGAAFAIKREVFEEIKGFDKNIFMYAEDVDLSWRVREKGYKIQYCPKVRINHYSYVKPGEIKPTQYVYSIINNLILRYKFGSKKQMLDGYLRFIYCFVFHNPFPSSRRKLFFKFCEFLTKINKLEKCHGNNFVPAFLGFDYEVARDGAFYNCLVEQKNTPLVSIIVRTCNRPSVLAEALQSIRNQTYKNIEIIVVEDGKPASKDMLEKEFSDLNINYYSTEIKVGRSKAGNIALSRANGKYCNFLDDDDVFFADHVELLVDRLEKSKYKVAYALAFETPINVYSQTPYTYKVFEYRKRYIQAYDELALCHHNYIPIECAMFERTLFIEYGGFDEELDALEDWDLWVRYSLHTDFEFIEKTTSIYRVPFDKAKAENRQKMLDEALIKVRKKHETYKKEITVKQLADAYEK